MTATEKALEEMNSRIAAHPADADAYYQRARLHWALGNRAEAITDYGTAAELNPDGPAATALEHINAIMDFMNPDLYNP
jgi:tetratricopeptide (TPR) repeat protein